MNSKRAVGITAALLILSAVGWASTQAATASDPEQSAAPQSVESPSEPATALSANTRASLGHYGTKLVVVDSVPKDLPISREVAEKHAMGAFDFTAGRTPDEMVLGTLTVPTHGDEIANSPAKASEVVPSIADRLVWFVVFHDVEQPRWGPVGKDGEAVFPDTTQKADMWIAVDARTGKNLGGETID